MTLEVKTIHADLIRPNPWNPNVMTAEMMEKERASIREFGFIDPMTVRQDGEYYQIIDGEQRWGAGLSEDIEVFPCIVLDVSEDEARELTIILNDVRGQFEESRLASLVQDLSKRRERARMENLLPYDSRRIDQLIDRREIDWSELEKRREDMQNDDDDDKEPWVERVFRMPRSSAKVLDAAISKVQEEDGIDQPWRALEMIAADFNAG
jgi:ParB-like chromosome segregation protein Spo0J